MDTTMKKVTKRDSYNTILGVLDAAESQGITIDSDVITYDTLRACVENELGLLDKKAEAAAKRSEKRKEEGDELREQIYETLSETEGLTIRQIIEALGVGEMSDQKISNRLAQLAKLGKVEKEVITVPAEDGGKSRKLNAYRKVA